ncbi:MAG: elongation factor P [Phycisphaerae bacterium]
MAIRAIDLRRGQVVEYKDGLWACVNNEKVAKGKGQSYQTIKLKNIQTGQQVEERFRTVEPFEPVHVDRKQMEYLYSDGSNHVVMDPETFEQVYMNPDMLEGMEVYLQPNIQLEVAFVQGNPVTVELPNSVELVVENTPPQVKGATVTNQLKEAICQGGAKVKVPPFIENGEKIEVDTRTGEYLGRA